MICFGARVIGGIFESQKETTDEDEDENDVVEIFGRHYAMSQQTNPENKWT